MATYKTSQANNTVEYDSASILTFDGISALGDSVAVSTVQDVLPLPFACKIYHVSVAYTGTLTGTIQLQIVTGAGDASGATVGTSDTIAPANTILFATAPTITAAAGITQTFYPDVFDAIYAGSNTALGVASPALTLRFITSDTDGDGISGITKVTLGIKPVNIYETADYAPTPAGYYGFDPSVLG